MLRHLPATHQTTSTLLAKRPFPFAPTVHCGTKHHKHPSTAEQIGPLAIPLSKGVGKKNKFEALGSRLTASLDNSYKPTDPASSLTSLPLASS